MRVRRDRFGRLVFVSHRHAILLGVVSLVFLALLLIAAARGWLSAGMAGASP